MSSLNENRKQQQNIEKVLQAQQKISVKYDTEFAFDDNVQEALAKSRNSEIKNNQPTYEPNKAF
jgi:methionine synthase II (cobalamin-independent)